MTATKKETIMKAFFAKLWDRTKAFVKSAFVLAIVPVTVGVLDLLGCLSGGLLGPAVLSGVILCVSIFFVTMNLSPTLRTGVYRFIGSYGGWLDLVATVVLTYLGFKMGVTMGLVAMMMGLNLSAMFSIVRISQILTDPYVRHAFADEMSANRARHPKPRNADQSRGWAPAAT